MSKANVVVFTPGSTVKIGPEYDPVDAVVLAVSLRESSIQYEVVWWLSGRQTAWVADCEVRASDGSRAMLIGFHGGQGGGALSRT